MSLLGERQITTWRKWLLATVCRKLLALYQIPGSRIITQCSESDVFPPRDLIFSRSFPLRALLGATEHPKSTRMVALVQLAHNNLVLRDVIASLASFSGLGTRLGPGNEAIASPSQHDRLNINYGRKGAEPSGGV